MAPQVLEEVLKNIPKIFSGKLLVKPDAMDDAGAYLLDEERVVVQSVDYFTPVVDDPYDFGWISAVNSLSDIYAMGAKPMLAMNVVGFPASGLDNSVLSKILSGGVDLMKKAAVLPMGGHTIKSPELFFGLSVTGFCSRNELLRNNTASAGDHLVLTKPIGTGAYTTAAKNDTIDPERLTETIAVMKKLNDTASLVALKHGASAMTDISGFGLLGHLFEMIKGTGLSLKLNMNTIPIVSGALDLIREGAVPGGMKSNLSFADRFMQTGKDITNEEKLLLADPQTSGGLAIAVEEKKILSFVADLKDELSNAVIGKFVEDKSEKIIVSRNITGTAL